MDDAEEGPIPPWRYALAATLGLALLASTYVLFDPDLGTEAPLFQEFTCTGRLAVGAGDGLGRPQLASPEMALKMNATDGATGELRPALFRIFTREAGADWEEYYAVAVREGEHFIYLRVSPTMEAYVEARDLEGEVCAGKSQALGVPAPISAPEPSSPPP